MSTNDFWFPFERYPDADWHKPNKYFGAPRRGTPRLHAGCDLIMPVGTWIHAVYDGVLVQEEKFFYHNTWYVTYQHGSYLVRYGEILHKSSTKKKVGDTCKRGEKICKVGQLSGGDHMLHLELYTNGKDHTGLKRPYSKKNRYCRRTDVTDPSPHLDDWVTRLAPP